MGFGCLTHAHRSETVVISDEDNTNSGSVTEREDPSSRAAKRQRSMSFTGYLILLI